LGLVPMLIQTDPQSRRVAPRVALAKKDEL
jgi:hypothetical protein